MMKTSNIFVGAKWIVVLVVCVLLFGYGGNLTQAKDVALADQFEDLEEVAKFTIFKSYDCIHPNTNFRIAVKVSIKVLWHINSNEPSEDYMIGTSIEIPPEGTFELKDVIYPEPAELLLGFSDSPVSVYEGEVFIGGTISIPSGTSLGKHKIPIHINYQACNDSTCLPPQSVKKEISVEVVGPETPLKEINKDIFAKLDGKA